MAKALVIKPSIKEIMARIKKVIDDPQARRRVLLRGVLEVKDLASAYPVEGEYNKPGHTRRVRIPTKQGLETRFISGWYQRGYGSRWLRNDGSYGGNNTSQRLQQSWQTEVQRTSEFTASAFTDVTYAPYLLDEEKPRVRWAESHGWQSLDEIQEQYEPRFEKLVLDEVDDQINKI